MKLICTANENCWAKLSKEVWTRNDLNHWRELLADAITEDEKALEALKDYYKSFVADIQIEDINGKQYQGVDAVFEADALGDVDGAVVGFLQSLPRLAYDTRSRLGNVRLGS